MKNSVEFYGQEVFLSDLCQLIYEMFGQWAVIDFIKDRQDNGELSHILWANCDSCEVWGPMDFDFVGYYCLVCFTSPEISPLTGEPQCQPLVLDL